MPELAFRPSEPSVAGAAGAAGLAGVEVLRLEDLPARVTPGHLHRVHRPAFHHLVHVASGTLRPTVDFADHEVRRGSWLWIRPGQVHRWGALRAATGTMVLFRHESVDAGTAALVGVHDPDGPTVLRPTGVSARTGVETLARLRDLAAGSPLAPAANALAVRHLLAVVLLHVVGDNAVPDGSAEADAFVAFRRAVERDFAQTRRVEDYAARLGWSVRTLSRATRRATAMSAKELIDRRAVLEAERLLAHTDLSAARIGAQLGFESATNFGKFFVKHTGTTPGAFRIAQHPDR